MGSLNKYLEEFNGGMAVGVEKCWRNLLEEWLVNKQIASVLQGSSEMN